MCFCLGVGETVMLVAAVGTACACKLCESNKEDKEGEQE